ncbi:MAG TPA: hypothetical protein VMF89_19270, partial [Polyangiales bacterium]|nr:hypothetical protein [Polyangiales bacterium]
YSLTAPIVQAKALLCPADDNSWPGLALAVGAAPPLGVGSFTSDGWVGFAYAAMTQSLFNEALIWHANVGLTVSHGNDMPAVESSPAPQSGHPITTWGFGAQVKVIGELHGIAEMYFGDPYDPSANYTAAQAGLRYMFSEDVQLDGTFGTSLQKIALAEAAPQMEAWGTLGVRLVSSELW